MLKSLTGPRFARFKIIEIFTLIAGFVALATTSCSLPGWNSNLQEFVNTGYTTAYLASSSYSRAAGETNVDVRSGELVTVTLRINNPKSIPLSYKLDYNPEFVIGTVTAPANTESATNGITTVSFNFTPSEAAEHGYVTFTLGLSGPTLNRTFDSATITIRCDSPPDPVTDLVAGIRSGGYADIGFRLPKNYLSADIAQVRITYTNTSTGTGKTVTESVSREGPGLTDVPTPALLSSEEEGYERYFIPVDVIAGNPYTFTVTTIDASGKVSEKISDPPSVSVKGNEHYLGYDINAATGTGTAAASFGYNQGTATVAPGTSLYFARHYFMGWNTKKDGSGTDYKPGDTFTFPDSDTILYAQWLPLGDTQVDIKDPIYEQLVFDPPNLTVTQSASVTIEPSTKPATITVWAWYVDGAQQQSETKAAFIWNTAGFGLGSHRVMCMGIADGIAYSGSVTITIIENLALSYDGNGNDSGAAPSPQSFKMGDTVTLTPVSASFKRGGYAFAGWATSAARADAGTIDYADGATTPALTENLVLYAVWTNVAPAPITNLTATADNTKITLGWSDPADADLDHIEITFAGPTSGTISVNKGAKQCVLRNLKNGSAYTITVTAVDREGTRSSVKTISATPVSNLSIKERAFRAHTTGGQG